MFTILGGDGKEYGPATVDQIRQWISSGRANLDTRAKALGSDEWRRLGDYVEFTSPAGAPPVVGAVPVPVAVSVDSTNLADRGLRLGAYLIDAIIKSIVAIPGAILLGTTFLKAIVAAGQGGQLDLEDLDVPRIITGALVLGFSLLALTIVQIWMLSTRGQSIGKRLLGVRIVMFRDGTNPGFVNAWLLRNLVPGIIGMIPWLGLIFALTDICFIFRDDRRCLHDLMAGTRVVKA